MIHKPKCEDPCLLTFTNHSAYVIIVFIEYIYYRNDSQNTLQVLTCAITPDGLKVVSGSADKTLKVWDIESGNELLTLKGHTLAVMIYL